MSVARTSESLQALHLPLLPDDWIDNLWESDFTDVDSTWPDDFQTVLEHEGWLLGALSNAVDALIPWVTEKTEPVQQNFWLTLKDCEVTVRGLTALIYGLVANCDKKILCGPERESAVLAARLYVTVLRVPGSGAFKVFHPFVYQKCVELLRGWSTRNVSTGGKKRGHPFGQKGGKQRKQRRGECSSLRGNAISLDDNDDDQELPQSQSSASDSDEVHRLQTDLLRDVVLMLGDTSLRAYVQCIEQLIQIFSSLTRMEFDDKPISSISARDVATTQSPRQLAFIGLQALCQPLHGSTPHTLLVIFKCLTPNLLMLLPDGRLVPSSTTIPRRLVETKNITADFICHVIQSHADNKDVQTAVRTLVQQLCVRVADRAEYRVKVAQTVCHILNQLPVMVFSGLVSWIRTLAKTTQVCNRMMALEVLVCLAMTGQFGGKDGGCHASLPLAGNETFNVEHLICIMLARFSDRSPNVRSKALSCVAACATHKILKHKLKQLLYPQEEQMGENDALTAHRADVVLPLLVRRTTDEKSPVRRVALQVLESVLLLDLTSVTEEMLNTFYHRSMDPSLSVRKQALSSITNLLMALPHNTILHSLWLDAVLPVIVDQETSAQEKCLELLDTVILKNIVDAEKSSSVELELAWNLLDVLASKHGQQLRRHLQKVCLSWGRQKKLNNALVRSLISHAQDVDSHTDGAWLVLSCISPYCSIDAQFVLDNYRRVSSQQMSESDLECQILSIMGNMASQLTRESMETLESELNQRLMQTATDLELVSSIITCLTNFNDQLCNLSEDKHHRLLHWARPIFKSSAEYIRKAVMGEASSDADSSLVCHLFTAGELAQRCPDLLDDDLCGMVQSLIVGRPDHVSAEARVGMSVTARAHAFITLGKLCLQKKELAKESVGLLVQELEENDDPVVRNNVIVVMRDLCVRYTSMVDHYIPNIALCLQDRAPFVRRQTIILLTNLLQEDYIKWRGSLFFHFVMSLVDKDREIRQFAKFCLVHLLLIRHPEMFFQHFVECVFHFNGYEAHPVYNKFMQSEKEKTVFCLKGNEQRVNRMTIYRFLLENVTDEQRFQITARLSQDVLGGVVDDVIPLNGDSVHVIGDTLAVLCSPEIKLTQLRSRSGGDEGQEVMEDENPAEAALAKAKTKIVSQLVKKTVMETVVPIIIALKQMLERAHSPLLRELMTYLQELMKDYKDELHDIMAADRQLASEIEFDLRRFEAEKKEAARAAEQSARVLTPHAQMVSPMVSMQPLNSGLRTPLSKSAPKLREAAVQRSHFKRNQALIVSSGSPMLAPTQTSGSRLKSPAPGSAGKATEEQQMVSREAGGQENLKRITSSEMARCPVERKGKESKSPRPSTSHCRAISTPAREHPSISFRAPTRASVSLAMPPSPIQHETSVIFLDYPQDKTEKRVWNIVSPFSSHRSTLQKRK